MLIEDGTGSGVKAGVDCEHRVAIRGAMTSMMYHASVKHNRAYTVNAGFFALGLTGGRKLWLRNDSASKHIIIEEVIVTWNGGSASHNECLFYDLYGSDEIPTANNNIITPVNVNIGSGNVADCTVYGWDGVGDGMTGGGDGNVIISARASAAGISTYTTGLVLRHNATLGINLKAEDEVGEAAILVAFYFVEPS